MFSGFRSTRRPSSIARHFSIADSTSRFTSADFAPGARLASTALMISACSDGSCSSR
jgi:hypothetical protein